ncbi:MAG: hypothetical protein H6813_03535 [Phycisphaeraceae bacterium]|nr:hypothetical protein [Phycisphaeraceae bacterium]MCB9847019.1 hypothetical protein [Phycisphaeraceae bacterium]
MTSTRRAASTALLATLALAPAPLAGAATPGIEEIAPPDAIAVLGVDNFADMRGAFDASYVGRLWRDDDMQAWFHRLLDEGGLADDFTENGPGPLIEEALDNAVMERDDLAAPTGPVGAALWWGEDTDTHERGPRWVAIADFGDHAKSMRDFYEALIDAMHKDDDLVEIRQSDYEGADVWSFTLVRDEQQDDAGVIDEDDWENWQPPEPEPFLDHGHVAWLDNVMIIAGDNGALELAINRINGDQMNALADTPDYAGVRSANEGAQLYAAAFVQPILDAFLSDDEIPGVPIDPMLEAFGVKDIRSIAGGVRFDGPGGAMIQTFSVGAPVKKGIVALFDNHMRGFNPPAFVGADASSLFMFQFDWTALIPLANQVVNSIDGEDQRMQAQMMLGIVAGGMGPIFDAMGPECVIVSSVRRPFTTESQQVYAAFEVRNRDAIVEGVNNMEGMLPVESRDFQGNQIWDLGPGAALGLGLNRLYTGPTEKVEDALRQAGAGDAATLADEPAFRDAVAPLRGGAMLYSYQNSRDSYEYAVWSIENLERNLRAQLEEYEFDPQTINEIVEQQVGSNPLFKVGMPPAELIFRYVGGHAVFEMHSTDDGFRGRGIAPPAEGLD